jgi:hypothetical protein
MEIDPNIDSRVKGGDELKQARDKRINLKFTLTKEATFALRIPQREGYHQEPLFVSHKGKSVLTKRNPQRIGNTNVFGCSTRREHSTGDANRLDASFKSNKCESINQSYHKCFLRLRC